jgi:hypothetical protein
VTRLRRWGTIQEYVDFCRAQGYFTPAFYATAIAHMERIHVRRRLKQITNARGWPVFGNIARVRDDGRPERVFLQEELFGPEEYQQIVAYHYGMARHHLFKAQTYRDHAKARYRGPAAALRRRRRGGSRDGGLSLGARTLSMIAAPVCMPVRPCAASDGRMSKGPVRRQPPRGVGYPSHRAHARQGHSAHRLPQAGIRLGRLLNRAFGGE